MSADAPAPPVTGTILSARGWLDVMEKGPGFSKLLWDYVDGEPRVDGDDAGRCLPQGAFGDVHRHVPP